MSDKIFEAFSYRSAETLNSFPFEGGYNTYEGGGYVYEMRGPLRDIRSNITKLRELNWIDRQTRAIFIEFSIYNPNINMLAAFELLIEFLPSGSLLTTSRIDPFVLFDSSDIYRQNFKLVVNLLFILCIILMIIKETKLILQFKLNYLRKFWNCIELLTIITSLMGLSIYIYKIKESQNVLDYFKQTSGYGYYKMQLIQFWCESFNYCLAFCLALRTLKFLKFLKINKIIGFLSATLKSCSKDLLAFSFIFFLLWFAFVQLKYTLFSSILFEYSTLTRSMTTCFLIVLGNNFHILKTLQQNSSISTIGLLAFIFYIIFVVFMLLNLLVTIITDTFSKIRKEDKRKKNDFELKYFLKDQLETLRMVKNEYKTNINTMSEYYDHTNYFPIKIDQLLQTFDQVRAN